MNSEGGVHLAGQGSYPVRLLDSSWYRGLTGSDPWYGTAGQGWSGTVSRPDTLKLSESAVNWRCPRHMWFAKNGSGKVIETNQNICWDHKLLNS